MDKEVYIFETSEKSFNSSVLLNSNKLPVVVEFMGVWSEPCVAMSDMFAELAREFAGQFIFARVDIDEQAGLKQQYNIENVPTVLVFKDAQVSRTEVGQMSEDEARAMLREYGVFRESDEIRAQAREKHLSGDTPSAIMLLTEAIQTDPSNTRIAMDMVQIFIDTGQTEEASGLFARLPEADKLSDMGKSISGQLLFKELAAKTQGIEILSGKLETHPDDHDLKFDLAICQVAEYEYQKAMDNLFLIHQAEPNYKDGAAREMIITLVNMLTPSSPELAQQYRRKLANTLSG